VFPFLKGRRKLRGDAMYTLTRRNTKAKMVDRTHPIGVPIAQWIRYQPMLQNIAG
jgi:hypothetical protein